MPTNESNIWGKAALGGRGDGVVGMPIAEGVGPSWPFMLVLSSPVVVSDLFRELEEGVLVSSHLVHRELVRFDIGFKSRRMVKLSGKQLAYARRFHQMTKIGRAHV